MDDGFDTISLDEARRRQKAKGSSWQAENPGYKSAKLKTIDPVAWDGKPVPERRWIVDGWLPEETVMMLSGDGGLGKTLLAQQLMAAAATGSQWLGVQTRSCRALGIFCEDSADELHMRQDAINKSMGIGFGQLENMQLVTRQGMDNALMDYARSDEPGMATEFYQQIHNLAQDFGAELIILDSLHDLFAGNENSRIHARQFINLLAGLARDCAGGVVLCAHPSQAGLGTGSGYSGSTAWHNAVRSRAYLTRPVGDDGQEDPDTRILKNKKANYARIGAEIRLEWFEGAFRVPETPVGAFKAMDDRKAERVFMDGLDRMLAMGRPLSDSGNAKNYAPKILSFGPHAEGVGKYALEQAMERLFQMSEIIVGEPIVGDNRHGRRGIMRRPK